MPVEFLTDEQAVSYGKFNEEPTRPEQGRNISVSPQVLDSVARVLRLTHTERRHLYVLAELHPPVPEAEPDRQGDTVAGLQRMIDAWMPYPAHIMDLYYNTVLFNDAAATVLGMKPGITQNCLVDFFTNPMYRARTRSWEQNARTVVAQFRAASLASPDDEGFQAVASELKAASPEFAELWERRDIEEAGQIRKEMIYPVLGLLYFESSVMRLPARPDLSIVLHTPLEEADTAGKLEWLASPEGRRAAMYPVAG
ncbi:XRE family transcriptional regulator [Streptomyces tibetensis]